MNYTPLHPNNIERELTRVNKEMYERNVELAIRNQTLSMLRKIYEIINSSLGLEETAQKLIEAIVQELKFKKGFIAIFDENEKVLRSIAVSRLEKNSLLTEQDFFQNFKVSIDNSDNYCALSLSENKERMTNSLYEILLPLVDEKKATEIAEQLGIKTSIVYPLKFGQKPLGVLTLCLDKHVGFLSRAEIETLKEMIEVTVIAIERAQIYMELREANEHLKELDRLKDEFVSIASHELRTPMTAIKSYIWMALNKSPQKLDDQNAHYLSIAYQATERLLRLVEDMLTVSRIEGKRLQLTIEEFNLVDIVKQLYDELKIKADEKHFAFNLDFSDPVILIQGDKDKLREVIQNLVGNSLKFTPEYGNITTTLTKTDTAVVMTVYNSGSYIPPENIANLFRKFYLIAANKDKHPTESSTGLGLYICKQIVEMHKGSISARSDEHTGTTFEVTLPLTL